MFFDEKKIAKKAKSNKDVVDSARRAREDRQQHKVQAGHATKIQTWWRCRNQTRKFSLRLSQELDKKFAEISKLGQILKLKGIVLVPPPDVCLDLTRRLLVLHSRRGAVEDRDGSMTARINLFLRLVLLPSLAEQNEAKNLMGVLVQKAGVMSNANSATGGGGFWLFRGLLLLCLNAVAMLPVVSPIGGADTAAGVPTISNVGFQCVSLFLGLGSPPNPNSATPLFRCVALYHLQLFSLTENLLRVVTAPLLLVYEKEELASMTSSARAVARMGSVERLVLLLMLCVDAVGASLGATADASRGVSDDDPVLTVWVHRFTATVFSVPLLTHALSGHARACLLTWRHFECFLRVVCSLDADIVKADLRSEGNDLSWAGEEAAAEVLGKHWSCSAARVLTGGSVAAVTLVSHPSQRRLPRPAMLSAAHWLFGNVCGLIQGISLLLSPRRGIDVAQHNGIAVPAQLSSNWLSNVQLERYLVALSRMLLACHIEGLWQCKPGILWTGGGVGAKAGSGLTASAIPLLFYEQLLSLYAQVSFHQQLVARVLAAVCSDAQAQGRCPGASRFSNPHEAMAHSNNLDKRAIRMEIEEALQSTALNIARQQVLQQELNSNAGWLARSSKLAGKMSSVINSRISSVFSGWFGNSASSSASGSSRSDKAPPVSSGGSGGGGDYGSGSRSVASSDTEKLPVGNGCVTVEVCTTSPTGTALIAALVGLWGLLLPHAVSAPVDSSGYKLVTTLAFATTTPTVLPEAYSGQSAAGNADGGCNTSLIGKLWLLLLQYDIDGLFRASEICCVGSAQGLPSQAHQRAYALLVVILCLMRVALLATNDSELYELGRPVSLLDLYRLSRVSNGMVFRTFYQKQEQQYLIQQNRANSLESRTQAGISNLILNAMVAVLKNVHSRWARKPFSTASLWELISTSEVSGSSGTDTGYYNVSVSATVCLDEIKRRVGFGETVFKSIPWCVNFYDRMYIIREWLDTERIQVQGGAAVSNNMFFQATEIQNERSKGIVIRIRHSNLLADGITAMNKISASGIKDRIVVRYVNDFGIEEMGIDIGGLFKDFWGTFSDRMFNPEYGLFTTTSSPDQLLYPNPNAYDILITTGSCRNRTEVDELYTFVGRILGKAIFENITILPQFSSFFLAFTSGKYNFMSLIDDLKTLDGELYKNLMFLRTYEGDVEDLCLTFSVNDNDLGCQKEIDLIPNGSNISVTASNRHYYIQVVAKYYLHDRICQQSGAFFQGLYQVVHPAMLTMFCAPELQILISGTASKISVDDLYANTSYAGGYTSFDSQIKRFWVLARDMDEVELSLLLKFVTSCTRPPSLGFKALSPPFTVQRVECSDDSRLPTASTCFNILKLPTYSSKAVMKDKLLFAIKSGAGFDLS